jgi:hypothetical protein
MDLKERGCEGLEALDRDQWQELAKSYQPSGRTA